MNILFLSVVLSTFKHKDPFISKDTKRFNKYFNFIWNVKTYVLYLHHAKKLLSGSWSMIKVSGHQYQWLASGYDLEIRHF